MEYLDDIRILQDEFNKIEEVMSEERLEFAQITQQARDLRKKSSAHIDFAYRSKDSVDLQNELSRLETAE